MSEDKGNAFTSVGFDYENDHIESEVTPTEPVEAVEQEDEGIDLEITTSDPGKLVEEIARKQGWDPEAGPITAEEYIRRGPLLKEISARGKEVKKVTRDRDDILDQYNQLKEETQSMKKLLVSMQEEKLSGSLEKLNQDKLKAFQSGDYEKFTKIENEINTIRANLSDVSNLKVSRDIPQELQGFAARSNEHEQFVRANMSWISSPDQIARKMRMEAELIGNELSQLDGMQGDTAASRRKLFNKVTERLKEEFPDQFGIKKNSYVPVEDAHRAESSGAKSKKKLSYDSLPDVMKKSYDVNVTKSKAMTHDEFMKAISDLR